MSKFDPPLRTNFDVETDPYGNEVHCPICDACMEQESMTGEWVCKQYHEEDLMSQKEYLKTSNCPVCSSYRAEQLYADSSVDYPDDIPVLTVPCNCMACKATWNEIYKLEKYEMVGTK